MESVIDPVLFSRAAEIYGEAGTNDALDYLRGHGIAISGNAWQKRMSYLGIRSRRAGGPEGARDWTLEDTAVLSEMFSDITVPPRAIEERLDRSWASISNKARRLHLHRRLPPSPLPRLAVPRLTFTRPVLVIADAHVPYQHADWLDRCTRLAVAWGAREVILAGDAIDAQALSRFEQFDRPSFEDEQDAWGDFEESLLGSFEHVHWFLGNHEARLGKHFGWKQSLGRMVEREFVTHKDDVTVYDSYAVVVNGCWRLEHPKSSSQSVAIDLVAHHLMNVAVAHTHHADTKRDPSGRFYGIRIGAGADHSRMPYCTRITHAKYAMTNGALLLVPTFWPDGVGLVDGLRHYNLEPELDLERMHGLYSPDEWGAAA